MDLREIAERVAAHPVEARPSRRRRRTRVSQPADEEGMLRPVTEYSCRMDLSISADFEGKIPKDRLVKKLKAEMTAAVKAAMSIVARDFGLESTGVNVKPVKVECAMNDQ